MRIFALAMMAVVVLLTVIANLGLVDQVFPFLHLVPGGDLTGHVVIYGILSFAVNCWVGRSKFVGGALVPAGVSVVLIAAVTAEEMAQSMLATRTCSMLDLAASVAGILGGLVLSMGFWSSSEPV